MANESTWNGRCRRATGWAGISSRRTWTGVGKVERLTQREDARLLDLRVPDQIAGVTVVLGSITVDGVSLTVNAKSARDVIQISLIPFTLQHTTLGERVVGDRVHLEADTIGKYVAELLNQRGV